MTVKIDEIEPNIFPAVEGIDARDAGRQAEVIFGVKPEGKLVPVTVKLSYEQANALGSFWNRSEKTKSWTKPWGKDRGEGRDSPPRRLGVLIYFQPDSLSQAATSVGCDFSQAVIERVSFDTSLFMQGAALQIY